MPDRRQSARDKVIYGGVAESATWRDARLRGPQYLRKRRHHRIQQRRQAPQGTDVAAIARKGRSFLAKVIWWRDNFVGVAFRAETPSEPVSDLEERLRKSELKKRQLQRRIKELIGDR